MTNFVGVRLKEERERIGINQKGFAEKIGVVTQTQVKYEKDTRSPNGEYFAKAAKLGIDVQYVITGKRALPDKKLEALAGLLEGLSEQQRQEILASIEEKKLLNKLLKQEQDKAAS